MEEGFRTHIERESAKQRDQDRDDFHNETAGRDVGRMKRFLPGEARPGYSKSKQEKHTEQLSQLAIMMQNAEYAALYTDTVELVQDHAAKAEAGIENARSVLSEAGQTLEDLTDEAAKLHPDGAPVFLDENGIAVRADGSPLSPDETDSVVWPEDAPSYEEYRDAKQAYVDAQERINAWINYQLYLGDVQNRLNDPDNPLTSEELKQVQDDVEARIPAAIETYAEYEPLSDSPVQTSTSSINKPPI